MPFRPISIRKAMESVAVADWVLPKTQRQYAWGFRDNAKRAVIRLFDSLYRSYPIGAFLLWETQEEIPFREFQKNFDPEADPPGTADPTQWKRRKWLVYDGQQRLQTLYSCLLYSFADQVLRFNLFFDQNNVEDGLYGFHFADTAIAIPPSEITLCSLYDEFRIQGEPGKTNYRRRKLDEMRGNRRQRESAPTGGVQHRPPLGSLQ